MGSIVRKSYFAKVEPLWPVLATICLATFACTGVLYWLTRNAGYNFADEGYLWYGVIQTRSGRVPIRDFRAYDPGRYVWGALWTFILGSGLASLRFANYLVVFLAVALSSYLVWRASNSIQVALIAVVILLLWIRPIHKIIDCTMPLFSIYLMHLMITENAVNGINFWLIFLGLTWFLGLNHFLYNLVATLAVILMMAIGLIPVDPLDWFPWVGYLGIGLTPMIIFLLIPGTLKAYHRKKIIKILRRGTTNLKLPIPLPFQKRKPAGTDFKNEIRSHLTILVPASYISWILFNLPGADHWRADLFACGLIGLCYLNQYFSRADLNHLTQALPPFVLGLLLCFNSTALGILVVTSLLFLTFLFAVQPWYEYLHQSKFGRECALVQMGPSKVWLSQSDADRFEHIQTLILEHTKPSEAVFIAPLMVGIYPALGLKIPHYDNFPVYPSSFQEQTQMIQEIESTDVKLAFIQNVSLDGREDLRFENTHPKVWEHIQANMSSLTTDQNLPTSFHFFVRDQ